MLFETWLALWCDGFGPCRSRISDGCRLLDEKMWVIANKNKVLLALAVVLYLSVQISRNDSAALSTEEPGQLWSRNHCSLKRGCKTDETKLYQSIVDVCNVHLLMARRGSSEAPQSRAYLSTIVKPRFDAALIAGKSWLFLMNVSSLVVKKSKSISVLKTAGVSVFWREMEVSLNIWDK